MISISQVPLLILALTMLNVVQVQVNNAILREQQSSVENDAYIEANSIGGMMMDEIRTKKFDNKTVSVNVTNRSQLTTVDSLGVDVSETALTNEVVDSIDIVSFQSYKNYNDVDDYLNYKRTVVTSNLGNFIVTDSVCYVQEANTDSISNTPTWCKKVVVTVSHAQMTNPFIIKSLVVYTKQ